MRGEDKVYRYISTLICALSIVVTLNVSANAEEKFPTHPISMIVPGAPGGGTSIVARILAEIAEPILGQKIAVIDKPGGSGTIAMDAVKKSRPDGYNICTTINAPVTMVPHVLKTDYNPTDFIYITAATKAPMFFCVRSESPLQNAKELIEYARKNPGKLTYACDGIGGTLHFIGERIFYAAKVKLRPIPYGGAGESIKAILGSQVDVYGGSIPPALPHIKSGTLRGILVTSRERFEELPDVMGVADIGHPEAEMVTWRGIIGPKGIPADRLAILEKAFRQAIQTQKMKDRMKQLGETTMGWTGKEFEKMVLEEFASLGIIAKEIGLAPK